MREMKDSGIEWIGEIPDDWRIIRNKNAFTCSKELVGEKSELTQLLSLTTRGIKKKDINNAEGKLPESFDTYQFVKENDLVMCLFDLDCSAVFSGISPYNGMISPAYRVLSCKKCMEPKYADYWFQYISDGRKFNHYAKNIRYTLSYEEFSALPLLLPERNEQRRIADYLDRKCSQIDTIIARQQEVIEKLKAYKLSVITEAVTKGLNPDVPMKDSRVEWIGEVPGNWTKVKLKNICQFINGDRSSNYPSPNEYVDNGIPFLGADSLCGRYVDVTQSKKITKEKYHSMGGAKIQKWDILYTLRGSTIGKNAIATFDEGTVASSLMVIRPISLIPEYLLYWLNSEEEFQQRQSYINGSTAPNLSAENVGSFVMFLPPALEQRKIADYLDTKCAEIELTMLKKQVLIDQLGNYKNSLIYEVVTGKKEV